VRLIRKTARERVAAFDVKKAAQDDFDEHTQAFMKEAVWSGSCRSWCKQPLVPAQLNAQPLYQMINSS
jgi:hypothetical protein